MILFLVDIVMKFRKFFNMFGKLIDLKKTTYSEIDINFESYVVLIVSGPISHGIGHLC